MTFTKFMDAEMNSILGSIATDFPGSTSHFLVYAGTPPTDANTAISGQTLLADITLPASTTWATISARSQAKGAAAWDDSSADGGSATPPTFCRMKNSGDTKRIDMDAAVGSGTVNFTGAITAAQDVPISTFSISG